MKTQTLSYFIIFLKSFPLFISQLTINFRLELPMKALIVVFSYHHNNNQKINEVMAKVLNAQMKSPQHTNPEELQKYDLVGFGAGIDNNNPSTTLKAKSLT